MRQHLFRLAYHIINTRNYDTLTAFDCLKVSQAIKVFGLEEDEVFKEVNMLIKYKYKKLVGREL